MVSLFAQPAELRFGDQKPIQVLDTIIVFAKENFDIKDRLSDWSNNFNDIEYTISIFNIIEQIGESDIGFSNYVGGLQYSNGQVNYFSSKDATLKSIVKGGINPGDYEIRMDIAIHQPGVFYVVGAIKGKSERGIYFEEAGFWVINCIARAENRLTYDFSIKRSYDFEEIATYRFGESISFDFSISGARMNNLSSYHFKVYRGEDIIHSGLGSYINLDFITKNSEMVNKSFTVEGLYSGKLILFFNPAIPGPDSTYWRFELLPPEKFEVRSNWVQLEEFEMMSGRDVIDALDLRLVENRKFSFAWLTNQVEGAMITRPKLINMEVTCEPEGLLRNNSPAFRLYEEDYWQVIEINVDPVFINSIAVDAIEKVIVNIKFQTQFGDQKSLSFVGMVF
ncbi:MAG: hypothetical protein KJO12_04845 [Ignavibacteria bacterium]|nr:hypothetical protein [Ignavibacteria bacterium]